MDLPGKTDKDVKIELNHNVLTISSEKKNEKDEKSGKEKLVCTDLFSGSGIVARMLKRHSSKLKGFYKDKNTGIGCFGAAGKNALTRIFGRIELKEPVFSNFESDLEIYQKDTVLLSKELKKLDIAYLDPPYNQHPYGSNYFMLNLILKNKLDVEISKISGITQGWNRSVFNKPYSALKSMEEIVSSLDSKFIVISYNSEGFISFDEMSEMLKKYGKLKTVEIAYNTFRGSRNLRNRDIHVSEYLFILEK